MRKRTRITLTILVVLLTVLIGPVSSAVKLPLITENNAPFFLLFMTVCLAALTVWINEGFRITQTARYWLIIALCIGPLIGYTGWVFYTVKPATNYFILDATDNMAPFFNGVQMAISNVASLEAHDKHGLGLRIYGGELIGSDVGEIPRCDSNTRLLISPNFYEDAGNRVNNALDVVQTANNGSLLVAMNNAVNQDLINYNKPVTLTIITSGMYSECSPPPRPVYLNDTIEAIRAINSKIGLRILIVSVGDLTIQSFDLLQGYATDIGACYVNISTPANLVSTILTNSSYCSNYPISRPTPTLTP